MRRAGCRRNEIEARITLAAEPPDGGEVDPTTLERTGELLVNRLRDAGLPGPGYEIEGEQLMVTMAGQVDEVEVAALIVPGELQIRKVLNSSPAPGPADGADGTGDPASAQADLAAARAAVGEPAWTAAQELAAGWLGDDPQDPDLVAATAPFGDLPPELVAVLPPLLQYTSAVTCTQLNARPVGATATPDALAVACTDSEKLLHARGGGGGR